MAKYKTVTITISDDGSITGDIMGGKGKDCEGVVDDLLSALGDEKKVTKKAEYYKARIYAAKLLRSEMYLSDECIGRLIGRSKSMVNSYLNQTNFNLGKKVDNSLGFSKTQSYNSDFFKT